MNLNLIEITTLFHQFLWPFIRIGACFMVMPIFGNNMVPMKIKLLIALVVSLAVSSHIPNIPVITEISLAFYLLVIKEVMIGIFFGLTLQVVLQIFIMAGQMFAMQSGLGFASLIDPNTGVSMPAFSQLYLMLVSLVFLGINGHLTTIDILVSSFKDFPIQSGILGKDLIWSLIDFSSYIFKGALLIALPMVIALLMVNLAFGIVTKASPQLNIFALGFPITILLGLVFLSFSVGLVVNYSDVFINKAFVLLRGA